MHRHLSIRHLSSCVHPQSSEGMTRDALCGYLDLLCHQTPPILTRLSDLNGGSYAVSLSNAASFIRRKTLESIIEDKMGFMSRRIFSLLIQHRQLEQKQISDFAMMPLKDCREKLYLMLKANVLQLQEIPKSFDRAPSKTIYLWRVSHAVWYKVMDGECLNDAMCPFRSIWTGSTGSLLRRCCVPCIMCGSDGNTRSSSTKT